MSIRITFRTPKIGEHAEGVGKFQQKNFPEMSMASDWIVMHIPATERGLVKMWIDDLPITGATLSAAMRPMGADPQRDDANV
jgi:hypothetical protein